MKALLCLFASLLLFLMVPVLVLAESEPKQKFMIESFITAAPIGKDWFKAEYVSTENEAGKRLSIETWGRHDKEKNTIDLRGVFYRVNGGGERKALFCIRSYVIPTEEKAYIALYLVSNESSNSFESFGAKTQEQFEHYIIPTFKMEFLYNELEAREALEDYLRFVKAYIEFQQVKISIRKPT